MHNAVQATPRHNFSSHSTYFSLPCAAGCGISEPTPAPHSFIRSFIYHDAPLHSRGRDNVNIMFPSTRCDVFISGHVAERQRGRVTGAEVTLTASPQLFRFSLARARSALPWLRDESIGNDASRGCDGNLCRFQRAALVSGERRTGG